MQPHPGALLYFARLPGPGQGIRLTKSCDAMNKSYLPFTGFCEIT